MFVVGILLVRRMDERVELGWQPGPAHDTVHVVDETALASAQPATDRVGRLDQNRNVAEDVCDGSRLHCCDLFWEDEVSILDRRSALKESSVLESDGVFGCLSKHGGHLLRCQLRDIDIAPSQQLGGNVDVLIDSGARTDASR